MKCKERLEAYLREKGVPYQSQHHARAITAQEVAAPHHVNPLKASAALGVREVHLAEEERFADAFPDCEVGAMPPFGNLYEVPVYVDRALVEDETIVFRSGTHTDTMSVSYADFEKLVRPTVADVADPSGS